MARTAYPQPSAKPKRRQLLIPETVAAETKTICDLHEINDTRYLHAAHSLLAGIVNAGITSRTVMMSADEAFPLPDLSPKHGDIEYYSSFSRFVHPRLLDESEPIRFAEDLSLSNYATRALRLLNFAFAIQAGTPVHVENTGQGNIRVAVPFDIPRHIQAA